jgi:hypothetical protein
MNADKFAQDGRGDQNANETSSLVASLLGPAAPNALSIGRLRLSEPLERTKDLRGFLWKLSVTLVPQTAGRARDRFWCFYERRLPVLFSGLLQGAKAKVSESRTCNLFLDRQEYKIYSMHY